MAARRPVSRIRKSLVKKTKPLRFLVANGVNLDLLGKRETKIYGSMTLADLQSEIQRSWTVLSEAMDLPETELHFFQSNHEGVFLEALDAGWDGVVLNPGAWTHTSLALVDRIRAIDVPFVEVHLSNIFAREPARQHSLCSGEVAGVIAGFGANSYVAALMVLALKFKT
jgi:3-dehydroquinate dehydratase-2